MADAGDNSRALLTLRPDTAACQRRRQKWKVEFARYFVTPRRCPSTTPPPPGLRYLSRGKHRYHGTWIPAASPAALCLSRPSHPFAVPVLTVSIGDVVFEEHCMSILNFSWPQVACVTQCPVRGSRVVFVSFYDKSKQIQKFALRFPQLYDAESFLNCVQECSGDTMDIIPSGSDYVHEDSSASEYIASNGLQHKPDDASSFEEPTSDHRTEAPALCYREEPDQLVLEPLVATNIDNNHSGFPPSFTEILTNLSTKNEKDAEEPYPLTGTEHAPQEVYTLDTSHDVTVGSNETTAAKDIDATESTGDIMARIKTYMADNSFHGMSICSGSYFLSCGPCCCSKEKQLQICSVGNHLSIVRRFISILLSLSVLHLLYLPFVTPLCEELLFPPSAYKGLGTAISWGDLGSASAV